MRRRPRSLPPRGAHGPADQNARRPRNGLYLVLDRDLLGGRDAAALLESLLAAGVEWVQYRDKRSADREVAAELGRLGPLCRAAGAKLIVNDRAALAAAACVDGVHLGASDMPVVDARRTLGPGKLIGGSVDTVGEALRAAAAGADYLGAGAVFPTATKKDAAVLGLDGLARICRAAKIPVVAIGGIDRTRVAAALAAGASGIAVASAVLRAGDPAAEARLLIEEIGRARRAGGR
ncbi:MAG: thiamine phosphate synthase [Candidatus Aureabacteria bacterium]|nr:thiamine phosphate synthase [Candidatus Auribacterota bacterium]NLW94648.1 thiamine phosphate synthase [Chlamydiota bacterium]HOE28046.1 thiamine phosphate synthase [bacterium]HQM53305.1 thiamine phosphate synthase [bacterium]